MGNPCMSCIETFCKKYPCKHYKKYVNALAKEAKKKIKRPPAHQLEIIAFSLPWELLNLLPEGNANKDLLVSKIIEIWEKIK